MGCPLLSCTPPTPPSEPGCFVFKWEGLCLWPTLTLGLFCLVSIPLPCSSIWLLLKNPTFILLCLAGATEATLIAGMSTFGPKFLESQFSLSASEAATLFGENTP